MDGKVGGDGPVKIQGGKIGELRTSGKEGRDAGSRWCSSGKESGSDSCPEQAIGNDPCIQSGKRESG